MSWIVKLNNVLRAILAWVLYKGVAKAIAIVGMVTIGLSMGIAALGVWLHPSPLDLIPSGLLDDEDIE